MRQKFSFSTAYAKEVVATEILIFFHQQIWQEDFAGAHLLISTNLELLPVVFLNQADSVRLYLADRIFFSIIFYVLGVKKALMASILTPAS